MTARRALLEGILDYAGMFPPASLSLEEALERYAAHRRHPHAFMLGRLVVPAGRLQEVRLPAGGSLSVLVGPGEEDLRLARDHAGHVGATEVSPLAPDLLEDRVDRLPGTVFCEFGWGPELEAGLERLRPLRAAGRPVGLKLRTGGVRPEHHPSPERLAGALAGAAAAGVPVKFTAGLHRPVRWRNEEVGMEQYGFLNVFAAAMLAVRPGLPAEELVPVLEERRLEAFVAGDDLRVAGFRFTAAEVEELRRERVASFGSCSFTEPVEALEEAGWLERTEDHG